MSVSVAIVGAGWMGAAHAAAIAANGDAVALVVDADAARAEALAAHYGARSATTLEACRGCDAVVVATPSFQHLEQATALAAMRLNVLIEKPHRLPNQPGADLRDAIAKTGAIVRVGMTTRFHEGILALAEALRAGALGTVLSYSDSYFFQLGPDTLAPWYFDPAFSGGGVVTTNGVHLIDRCAWLLDEDLHLEAVDGLVPLHADHEVEDHGHLRLAGARSGVPVALDLMWAPYACPDPELRVVGTKGMARIGVGHWTIETGDDARGGDIARPDDAFVRQWAAFRAALDGDDDGVPDVATLDTTLDLISEIYAKAKGACGA